MSIVAATAPLLAILCFAAGVATIAFCPRAAHRLRGAALVAAGCVLQVVSASNGTWAAQGAAIAAILTGAWAIELAWIRQRDGHSAGRDA